MRHVNARDVLPKELLREVQRYCSGYIYVPSTREFYAKRRGEIALLARRGLTVELIAERMALSERRVRQVLAERGRRGK
jgi:DNA-binding NarL/FixJ family response regulator